MKSIIEEIEGKNWEISLNSSNTSVFCQVSEEVVGIYVDGVRIEDKNIISSIKSMFNQKTEVFGSPTTFIDLIKAIIRISDGNGFDKKIIGLPKVTKQLFSANQNSKLFATFLDKEEELQFLGFGINVLSETMQKINGFNMQPLLLYEAIKFVSEEDMVGAVLNEKAIVITRNGKIAIVLGIDYEVANNV